MNSVWMPKNIMYVFSDDKFRMINFGIAKDVEMKFNKRKHSYKNRKDIRKESDFKNPTLKVACQFGMSMFDNATKNRFIFEMKAVIQSETTKIVMLNGSNDKKIEWYKIEDEDFYIKTIPRLCSVCRRFGS